MDTTKGVANRADPKKRTSGPPIALLKNSTNRGSTSSDQDSPPIVANTSDSPLSGRKTSTSVSRAPSIRMKQPTGDASPGQQGTPESRSKSPSPRISPESRERSESLQSESLMSAAPDAQSVNSGSKAGANKRGVDSARKKILWAASKGEWGSPEQMLKILEQSVAGNRNSPDGLPLANVQDEVSFHKSIFFEFFSFSNR